MSAPKVLIVGAGLTGCTLAHRLAQAGCGSVLLDREAVPGGLIGSELGWHGPVVLTCPFDVVLATR